MPEHLAVHVAIIEWDSSESPEAFVGTTAEEVRRRAAFRLAYSGFIPGDDPTWFDDNKLAPAAEQILQADVVSDAAIDTWLAEMQEALTVPWLTMTDDDFPIGAPPTAAVEHGPDTATWFARLALIAHWREHGFTVVDDHGTLVKHPVTS